jgi:hypothetical protein
LGANVATKVAAAGLHFELQVFEGRLGSSAVVGPYDQDALCGLWEIAIRWLYFLEAKKKLSQLSEAAPCACIIGVVPDLVHVSLFGSLLVMTAKFHTD